MKKGLLVLSLLCWILCSALSFGEPKLKVVFGFSGYQPVVFLQVKAGMSIRLKVITYDQFGHAAVYEEEIIVSGQAMHIKIVANPELKPTIPETYLYAGEIDGKASRSMTLAEWARAEKKGLVGFTPIGLGGAVIQSRDGLEADFKTRLKTSLVNDDFGRETISTQELKVDGIGYLIIYSGREFDEFGRLSAYSAEIKAGI